MIVTLLVSGASATSVVDRVAAVVNDDVVALSEVYEIGQAFIEKRCPQSASQCMLDAELEILDVKIRRTLIRQELDKLDLTVTAADVDQAIDKTVRDYQLESRSDLKAQVEAQGQRWDKYREEIFEYLRTVTFQSRVLAPRVTMSEDEVRDRFQRETRNMKKPTATVSGFGMAVPADASEAYVSRLTEEARGIVKRLNEGKLSWSQAVSRHDTANMAGNFGREVLQGELVEPIDKAVFATDAGSVTEPVALGPILFVLRVEERGERSMVTSFEESQEQIRNVIFQEKLAEAEEEWYQRARREAVIDVKLK
ncbi:MAG: peptidylprolyl isomerase [Myxococcales bacterium]|nr:peptidylprolyl isomerase [Myxococcales bacterium]